MTSSITSDKPTSRRSRRKSLRSVCISFSKEFARRLSDAGIDCVREGNFIHFSRSGIEYIARIRPKFERWMRSDYPYLVDLEVVPTNSNGKVTGPLSSRKGIFSEDALPVTGATCFKHEIPAIIDWVTELITSNHSPSFPSESMHHINLWTKAALISMEKFD